ncbi:unnamed protein product [Linum tenue]|uniref:Late embryogenesis abundant protein LEA-2 subgroup domain-containing protein n=1 Tax=Linum tenue TaxID=586396 RepID=A0AAV0KXJ7_9ROSI|nr:unnamed protein product [Linum tenue]
MDSSSTSADREVEQQRLGTAWILHHHSIAAGDGYSSSMQSCPYYVQSPLSSTLDDDVAVKASDEEDEHDGDGAGGGEEYYYEKMRPSSDQGGGVWRRCFSFSRRSSCSWITVQLLWRFLVSFGLALLVFYIATKPPPPKVSVRVAGMSEFQLAEGVDSTGVTTKILTCNCSLDVLIKNKSKLFGLHVHPPILELSFGHLLVAMSRGSKFYAENHDSTSFRLYVGTRNKPMYGAGRNMQDLMESGRGLPIVVRVGLSSYFRVVSSIIRPKFHHKAECMLLLDKTYDKKHQTQTFRSSCIVS